LGKLVVPGTYVPVPRVAFPILPNVDPLAASVTISPLQIVDTFGVAVIVGKEGEGLTFTT
jgi:hypothetical protein